MYFKRIDHLYIRVKNKWVVLHFTIIIIKVNIINIYNLIIDNFYLFNLRKMLNKKQLNLKNFTWKIKLKKYKYKMKVIIYIYIYIYIYITDVLSTKYILYFACINISIPKY